MFVLVDLAGEPAVAARPRRPSRRRDLDRDLALRVRALGQRVDVVGDEPRVAAEDVDERRVDRLVERVDRAVALGGGLPVVVAGPDHDGGRGCWRCCRT